MRATIYGAGSSGNHLAFACRQRAWSVTVTDIDPVALERMRSSIYPSRYGSWDPAIELVISDRLSLDPPDVAIVSTPPDTHVPLAIEILRRRPPKVLLIEKPLATPDLAGCDELLAASSAGGGRVLVGYNHLLCENTRVAARWLAEDRIGRLLSVRVRWVEHWEGIFRAHPWISGPDVCYLGDVRRGGGACCEHSHAISLFQHFARAAGRGGVSEVSARFDFVECGPARYDRIAQLLLRTEDGLEGMVLQDVITRPSEKSIQLVGERGSMTWVAARDSSHDAVVLHTEASSEELVITRARPDDFRGEIDHLAMLLEVPSHASPIALEHGLETMQIIAAAQASAASGRTARVSEWPKNSGSRFSVD